MACGGDDNGSNNATANVLIPAEDADRVAHAALPGLGDLPGENWRISAQDEFNDDAGDDFLQFIEGNPDCETLEQLATLRNVFGDDDDEDDTVGRAQVEFEQAGDSIVPTSVEVEIEIDRTAVASGAEFALVKTMLESDETERCLISAINSQFSETGPGGIELEVTGGNTSASAPRNGAGIAFDVGMSFAGIDIDFVMEMYFWPYGNAGVQALFLGAKDSFPDDLVEDVLKTVDRKLEEAAAQ